MRGNLCFYDGALYGRIKKVTIRQKKERDMLIALIIIFGIFCIICLISMFVDTNRFIIRKYVIESPKITEEKRVVLIADLHNKQFDEGNGKLLAAIDKINPDFILSAGDILTAKPNNSTDLAIDFMGKLSAKYTVYNGMGNHEYRLKLYPDYYVGMYETYKAQMIKDNCPLLDNETMINGEFAITGLNIDRSYYKRFKRVHMEDDYVEKEVGAPDKERFQILIAHNPEYFDVYSKWGADLVVSGHVHGGMMRLPLLGGVISPKCVPFPKYDGGMFEKNKTKLIISRGLGCHTIPVRVFNPGELIEIHLKPCKS